VHKIKVETLYNGMVEIHINDIKKTIETHNNLLIEHKDETMEISWQKLVTKFKSHIVRDSELKLWSFKFVPNICNMEN